MRTRLICLSFGLVCISHSFACGSNDLISDEEARDRYSCEIIEGPEGSEEFVLRCGDEQALISSGKDGDNGQSCTVTDNDDGTATLACADGSKVVVPLKAEPGRDGRNGTNGTDGEDGNSADIRSRVEPPGANCPEGGTAIEFYIEGELTPRATTYDCDEQVGAVCPPKHTQDPELGFCVPAVEFEFTGVLEETLFENEFPAAMLPSPLVTESQDPANATPCSGRVVQPIGLVPAQRDTFEGTQGSLFAYYEFGHVSLYEFTLTVGNVTYTRNDVHLPGAMSHERSYFPDFDSNTNTTLEVGSLAMNTRTEGIAGFPTAGTSWMVLRGLQESIAGDMVRMSMPQDLSGWSSVQNMGIEVSYEKPDRAGYGQIRCDITQFTAVP